MNRHILIDGVKGLTKATLQIDKCDDAVINQRTKICYDCDSCTKKKTDSGKIIARCKICKCFIKAKVRISSESCPLHKW
jgi:hypothetical protein